MYLIYLMQPYVIRNTIEGYYKMFDDICHGIGNNLPVRDVIFTYRLDLQTFEFIQVYREVVSKQIKLDDTLASEIRS